MISVTKGFVQWVQQLVAPLWDCMCGALLVPLKLEECHQMVKSRSEGSTLHLFFFNGPLLCAASPAANNGKHIVT